MQQLITATAFNIETQYHINLEQGDWHNFTNCYKLTTTIRNIAIANMSILVPYEDDKILRMIYATKRFLLDMSIKYRQKCK